MALTAFDSSIPVMTHLRPALPPTTPAVQHALHMPSKLLRLEHPAAHGVAILTGILRFFDLAHHRRGQPVGVSGPQPEATLHSAWTNRTSLPT